MAENLTIIILAAGKGTRIGGEAAKVLRNSFSGPLLQEVMKSAIGLHPEKILIVTGFQAEEVECAARGFLETICNNTVHKDGENRFSGSLEFYRQTEQRGTGDAVKAAIPGLRGFSGEVLILCGDAPVILPSSLQSLIANHREQNATVSLLTAHLPEPASYGRILRSPETGELTGIREARDSSAEELQIQEVNSGVYVVDSAFLPGAISQLEPDNAQGEFYLTDIVGQAIQEGQRVVSSSCSSDELTGVNSHTDLNAVNAIQQRRIRDRFSAQGVSFLQPESVSIHPMAVIGAGVHIGPSVVIGENVQISNNVTIEGMSYITNATIGEGSTIKWGCRIDGARVGTGSSVGPFAHLRPGSRLGTNVKIGNFVEVKESTLGDEAKASHLSYLGDAHIGAGANIGAGTITCNYDGYTKSTTIVGDGAFIGSNSSLVAPVEIGHGATVGAGSIITKAVAADALAVTRAEQRELAGWSKKKRERSPLKK
ncbi:MAG: bifunctional UDP-N-acetylglucosamine diphosphorylase/glucosamine-1-phosphate N-acetyltransferase GlmU [Bdellovibrionota bacterium]